MTQRIAIHLPTLHTAQSEVTGTKRRFNVLSMGRRWGKTALGQKLAVDALLYGFPVGWFSPTYKLLVEVWRELRMRLGPIIERASSTERRIETLGGGILEMWTLDDPNAGRSRRYGRVIVDEAAMIPHLMDSWTAAIRPTLADLRGDAWFLSTPRGRNGFYQLWQLGLSDPEWASWQMPTNRNPYIDAGEIEAMRQMLPERIYRQEVLAEFLEDAGGVFRKVADASTLDYVVPYPGRFVMGVDWAQKHDFTVLSVVDVKARRQVDIDRFNQIDWALQRGRLQAMAKKWDVKLIVAEENSIGGPNIEQLHRDGLPIRGFQTTATSKPPLIESLALALEQGDIELLNDAVQVNELQSYERTVSSATGRSRYSAPEGMHDDTVIALALSWYAAVGAPTLSTASVDWYGAKRPTAEPPKPARTDSEIERMLAQVAP